MKYKIQLPIEQLSSYTYVHLLFLTRFETERSHLNYGRFFVV